jgi:hypothetical protein
MRLSLALLMGCPLSEKDDTGSDTIPPTCPELDCRDMLTLTVLDVSGSPSDGFSGTLTPPDASPISFQCWGESSFEGGMCLGSGQVVLFAYAESFSLWIDEGDDAPYFTGTLTPSWQAPYDSEECGHYCWIAEESVQLEPCKDCG